MQRVRAIASEMTLSVNWSLLIRLMIWLGLTKPLQENLWFQRRSMRLVKSFKSSWDLPNLCLLQIRSRFNSKI